MWLFLSALIVVVLVIVGLEVERISGAETAKNVPLNAACGFLHLTITQLFTAAMDPAVIWASSKIGRPPIKLSGHGWMFPVSVVIMLALMDILEYTLHRLQHRIPWLWAMHSFHHSDPKLNASSALRNFWLDRMLHAVVFAPLGLLVHPSGPVVLWSFVALWMLVVFQHSNIRVGLNKYSWLIVTPQFHRTHHSIQKKHYDRNFAQFLPLLDMLFGTYIRPEGYPDTGLDEGEPQNLREVLLWAFRSHSSTPESMGQPVAADRS